MNYEDYDPYCKVCGLKWNLLGQCPRGCLECTSVSLRTVPHISAASSTDWAGGLANARNSLLLILLRHVKISFYSSGRGNWAGHGVSIRNLIKIVSFSSDFRSFPQKPAARGVSLMECTLYMLRMLLRQKAADILFIIINNISLPLEFRVYSTRGSHEGH